MKYGGALPSQEIESMISAGFISGVEDKSGIRPGSLDPVLSCSGFHDVYRVNGSFLPQADETVLTAIRRAGGTPLHGEKILLEVDCCYVFALYQKIVKLPDEVYSFANPKSSSGRVDLHVRLLVDYTPRFDFIPKGYTGPLWLLMTPRTFPVIVSGGISLNQLRFFNQDTRFDEFRLETNFSGLLFNHNGQPIPYENRHRFERDGSILLSLGLQFEYPGFEASKTREPIDLSLKNHYDPHRYFRPIITDDHQLTLKSDTFYILSSAEYVRVPAHLACEMRPMDDRSGEFRSHYAGFIDPGWGVGPDGRGCGRTLTLEVRSFDSGLIIKHGQPIAKIRFERMRESPTAHYDEMNPTYGEQLGPKLGKYFKSW